jgi:hypothetical protein
VLDRKIEEESAPEAKNLSQNTFGAHTGTEVSLANICVGICVRKTFQNMLKPAKIGKNRKNEKLMIPNTSLTLRRFGSSEVLPTNPQFARSGLAGRTNLCW